MDNKFIIIDEDDSFEKTMDKMMLPENMKKFDDKFSELYDKKNRIIPHVPKHDRALYPSGNSKEYCKCEKCKSLRKRRDKIFKCRLFNWL